MAVTWQARLAEHLGTVSGEPRTPYAARWLDDPVRLAGVSAACAVSEACLPERVPHPAAFAALLALFNGMSEGHWPSLYAHWELGLLGELGFGLDLTVCAATGNSADLVYVSRRAGVPSAVRQAPTIMSACCLCPPFCARVSPRTAMQPPRR